MRNCVYGNRKWDAPDAPGLYFFRIQGTKDMALKLRYFQASREQNLSFSSAKDELSDRTYAVDFRREGGLNISYDDATKSVLNSVPARWLYIGEALSLRSRVAQHSRNIHKIQSFVMSGRKIDADSELERGIGEERVGWKRTVQFYELLCLLYQDAFKVMEHKLVPHLAVDFLEMPGSEKNDLRRAESNLIELINPLGNYKT